MDGPGGGGAKSEAVLGKTAARLEGIIASAMDAIISMDEQQRVVLFNPAAEKMFGLRAEEALGQPINRFIPERFRAAHQQQVQAFGQTGVSSRHMGALGKVSGLRANGEEFPVEASISQLEAEGEKLFTVILRDISQQERAEEALQRIADIVESSEDAIITKDLNGVVTTWNPGAERLFGYTALEAIGQSITLIIPADRLEEEPGVLARIRRGERVQHYETVRRRKDGTLVEVSLSVSPLKDSRGQVTGASKIARDITGRKRAEAALRESEQRFRALGENIAQLAWMADPNGWVFWYNQRWYDYTGTTPQQMQEWGWEQVHQPSQLQRVLAKWQHSLETGQPWEDIVPLRHKDGHYGWFLSRAVPLRDSGGRITRWLGTDTDITELRQTQQALNQAQAELEEHATQLEETVVERTAELREANAELEAFCYSLSHDMRGPLRAIVSFTEFLMRDSGVGMNVTARDYLQRVANAAGRLDRLIQDVLAFSRLPRERVALARVEVEPLLRELIQERLELHAPAAEVSIEGPLPAVQGQEALLTQCLTNLLGNAVKFVPRGVLPRVRVYSEAAGEKVRLWVEDNGIGIEKGTQTKIFEVFQRGQAAADYEGTGIGLAIVRKAAQRMGGGVGVESESGRGSRFWLELAPAAP